MTSEPGDYIGAGQSYLYQQADGSFTARRDVSSNRVSVSFRTPTFTHFWDLSFAAPGDQPLTVGLYTGAARFPEGGQPGLDVYGDGRGCNGLTGSFQVKQVVYGAGEEIVSFWATFEQHCEGAGPALRGDVRYNADVVLELTSPPALSIERDHELAFDVTANETQDRIVVLTAAGLPQGATFDDNRNNTGTLRWTPTSDQIGFHSVVFHADNGAGNTDAALTRIRVTGELSLRLESDPGDPIGGGSSYFYGPNDGDYRGSTSNGHVGISLTLPSSGITTYMDFAAPAGETLTAGRYTGAIRFPFNDDRPGLSVTRFGSGCNTVTGEFTVKQIKVSSEGLESFWALFEQHCEGFTPALRGEIRYHANVVVALSAPSYRTIMRRRPLTFDVVATDANNRSVALTASGLPEGAIFTPHGDNTGTLAWTPGFNQTGTYVVTFEGDNGNGGYDSATTEITVLGETSLALASEPDAYVGQGQAYFYTLDDGPLRASSYFGGVTAQFGPAPFSTWDLAFAPPPGELLSLGVYPDAVRPGSQAPGQAGIYVSGLSSGCSQTSGAFQVKELIRDPAGATQSYWARFRQFCDQLPGALEGEIRFNVTAPLLVNAPPGRNAAVGNPVEFIVTGTAALPVSLDALDLPPGATFLQNADGSATFRWTPASGQAGRHLVRFTGVDGSAHSDTAVTAIRVIQVNRAPVANAGGPYQGRPGVPIQFDGSASSDPDGDALSYSWAFGDFYYGDGETPSHAYGATGTYNILLAVSDPGGLRSFASTTATVSDFTEAYVFYAYGLDLIFPQILGTWIRMEPADGSFDVHDVLVSSLRLTYNGTTIPSLCKSGIKFDTNRNGVSEIRACFRNKEIESLFDSVPDGVTTVTLMLEADLITGGKARGSTTAKVVKFSWLHAGSMATVAPNPLNPQAKLSFVTTKPGVTTIQVFDLNGRLVRNLMRRQYLEPGLHGVTIDGRNEQGNKLASGVYYYRVQSADGVSKGTIAVLK
jgi:hypothetical protein